MSAGHALARAPGALPARAGLVAAAVRLALVGAAAIHFWVVPEHLTEWWPAAVVLGALGAVQLLSAAALRPTSSDRLRTAVAAAQAGSALLWLATRTVSLPFLPAHGADHPPVVGGIGDGVPVLPGDRIEPVGLLDSVCVGLEVVAVLGLLAAVDPVLARRLRWVGVGALLLVGTAPLWVTP